MTWVFNILLSRRVFETKYLLKYCWRRFSLRKLMGKFCNFVMRKLYSVKGSKYLFSVDKEDFGVNIRGFKLWYSTFYQTVFELEFCMGEWFKHHYSMTPSNPSSCSMDLSGKDKNPLILHDYIGASKCAVDSYKV